MTQNPKESQNQISEAQIEYAYKVLDGLIEGMDRVATEPRLAKRFYVEVLMKMDKFVDAFMMLSAPEHRQMVGKLIKAMSRMGAECLKQVQKG